MNSNKKYLSVKWLNGTRTDYPYVFLRDNCQCPRCFHPTSKARLFLMQNLDLDIEPRHVEIMQSGDLSVVWPDGHESVFSAHWLKQRNFSKEKRMQRNHLYEDERELWTARSIKHNLPRGNFHEMMNSNEALYNFLVEFRKYGIGIVENMAGRGGMLRFCRKVAFEKKTHYGEMFEVKVKLDPSNLTYTGASLGLHTDLTYYDYQPGIQMLHCLQQAEGFGGDNGFVDAFKVGYTVKENRPDLYNILTTVPLDNWDVGSDVTDFYKVYKSPVIRLNEQGKIYQIRYNNQVRDSFMDMESRMVRPMYEAIKEFDNTCYDPDLTIKHKLKSGEMVIFDNWRVLHSRFGYNTDVPTQRELEGGFMDWDEINSTIRVLKLKMEHGQK